MLDQKLNPMAQNFPPSRGPPGKAPNAVSGIYLSTTGQSSCPSVVINNVTTRTKTNLVPGTAHGSKPHMRINVKNRN